MRLNRFTYLGHTRFNLGIEGSQNSIFFSYKLVCRIGKVLHSYTHILVWFFFFRVIITLSFLASKGFFTFFSLKMCSVEIRHFFSKRITNNYTFFLFSLALCKEQPGKKWLSSNNSNGKICLHTTHYRKFGRCHCSKRRRNTWNVFPRTLCVDPHW